MRRKLSGFTLIELMIVVAIIGILAATALPYFNRIRERARTAKCHENSSLLTRLSELYSLEKKVDPDAVSDLTPYISNGQLPKCPNTLDSSPYQFIPGIYPYKIWCTPHHGYASGTFGG